MAPHYMFPSTRDYVYPVDLKLKKLSVDITLDCGIRQGRNFFSKPKRDISGTEPLPLQQSGIN